jgi:hypothetical protein
MAGMMNRQMQLTEPVIPLVTAFFSTFLFVAIRLRTHYGLPQKAQKRNACEICCEQDSTGEMSEMKMHRRT